MKKILLILVVGTLLIAGLFSALNIEVTTRQGINYKVQTIKLPLYLKILDFYDRHFNYKWLVHRIIQGKASDEDKVMAIFQWTVDNIAPQPKELRAVDDHVWHIIVRGYGAHDQASDVFTTLCNYAGFDAFFAKVENKDKTSRISLSFVKIGKKSYIFHPYNGTYFVTKDGNLATVDDLASGNWVARETGATRDMNFVYEDYFNAELLKINFEESHKFSRANIQSPINRLIYGIKKR